MHSRSHSILRADKIGVRRKDQPSRQIGILSESGFNFLVTKPLSFDSDMDLFSSRRTTRFPRWVHLINATSSATLVFGAEKEGDAKEAQHSLKDEGKNLDLVQLFDVEKAWARNELPAPTDERDVFQTQVPYEQMQEAAFTLHSSGSTGFPKPYAYSHDVYLHVIADFMPYDALCTAPLYHGFACAVAWRQLLHRRHLYIFSETIRHDLVSKAVRQSTIEIIYGVPLPSRCSARTRSRLKFFVTSSSAVTVVLLVPLKLVICWWRTVSI